MTIQLRFDTFHAENPHVYKLFLQYSRTVKAKGYTKFSAKAVFERLRWYFNFETKSDGDDFKLNNDYTALYARKAMIENPDLQDFFNLRERISK